MELTIRGDKRDLVVVVLEETFVSCEIVEEVHLTHVVRASSITITETAKLHTSIQADKVKHMSVKTQQAMRFLRSSGNM